MPELPQEVLMSDRMRRDLTRAVREVLPELLPKLLEEMLPEALAAVGPAETLPVAHWVKHYPASMTGSLATNTKIEGAVELYDRETIDEVKGRYVIAEQVTQELARPIAAAFGLVLIEQ